MYINIYKNTTFRWRPREGKRKFACQLVVDQLSVSEAFSVGLKGRKKKVREEKKNQNEKHTCASFFTVGATCSSHLCGTSITLSPVPIYTSPGLSSPQVPLCSTRGRRWERGRRGVCVCVWWDRGGGGVAAAAAGANQKVELLPSSGGGGAAVTTV